KKFPEAKWHQWEPLTRDALREASAGGVFAGETIYDFSKAQVIVAHDSDFLSLHPAALRHARDFASRRRVEKPEGASMSRFYAAEPTPSITGSNADHRLPVAAHEIPALVAQINQSLGNIGTTIKYSASAEPNPVNQLQSLKVLVDDLRRGAVDFL